MKISGYSDGLNLAGGSQLGSSTSSVIVNNGTASTNGNTFTEAPILITDTSGNFVDFTVTFSFQITGCTFPNCSDGFTFIVSSPLPCFLPPPSPNMPIPLDLFLGFKR